MMHLEEGGVHAGAPELVCNNCSSSAVQQPLDHGEEGRHERFFEHAVAGHDKVRCCLRQKKGGKEM